MGIFLAGLPSISSKVTGLNCRVRCASDYLVVFPGLFLPYFCVLTLRSEIRHIDGALAGHLQSLFVDDLASSAVKSLVDQLMVGQVCWVE